MMLQNAHSDVLEHSLGVLHSTAYDTNGVKSRQVSDEAQTLQISFPACISHSRAVGDVCILFFFAPACKCLSQAITRILGDLKLAVHELASLGVIRTSPSLHS